VEELRGEALEARRIYFEQSLKMLPRARNASKRAWRIARELEKSYAEALERIAYALQEALVLDVDCMLRVLGASSYEELAVTLARCTNEDPHVAPRGLCYYAGMLHASLDRLLHVPEHFLGKDGGGRLGQLGPVETLRELVDLAGQYFFIAGRAKRLSSLAGMSFEPNRELERYVSSGLRAFQMSNVLMMRVTGHFAKRSPSPLYVAATALDMACEYLEYGAFLAMLERAGFPRCIYSSNLEVILGRLMTPANYEGYKRARKRWGPPSLLHALAACPGFAGYWRGWLEPLWGLLRIYALRALELYPAVLAGMGNDPRLYPVMDALTWVMLEKAGKTAWQALRENGDYTPGSPCTTIQSVVAGVFNSFKGRRLKQTTQRQAQSSLDTNET